MMNTLRRYAEAMRTPLARMLLRTLRGVGEAEIARLVVEEHGAVCVEALKRDTALCGAYGVPEEYLQEVSRVVLTRFTKHAI